MDCWVKSGTAMVPDKVSQCLAKLNETSKDRFPNNFLYYVQNNMARLVRMFIQTFSVNPGNQDGLDENSIKDIKAFAMGEGTTNSPMHIKIYNEFYDLKKQRDGIQSSIKELNKMIKALEDKPQDSSYDKQIKDLKEERAAWTSVVAKINEKNVFNFLSDAGLLPNYAFPEAGIVLKAVLTRVEKDENDREKNKYESTTYEYNRSASSAISEFAPLNSFYAGGHKLTIDQVDINTANDDPQKDGCYKCLYAYRQSQHIGEISRNSAITLLKTILSGKENRTEIKKLAQVDTNHLFDSELEREFVGAFEKLSTAERPIRIHKTLVNEKEGYSLQVGESLWTIEPQVDFDASMGISVKSRPDFVIRPKRTTGNQKPMLK